MSPSDASIVVCLTHFLLLAEADLWTQLVRVLSFNDLTVRVVVIGTALLGIASGHIGVYLLLRRRALIGDAISPRYSARRRGGLLANSRQR